MTGCNRGTAVVVALMAAAVGCVGTPQPDPPNLQPFIDEDQLFGDPVDSYGTVYVFGEAGAIEPPEALLRFWNLDAPTAAEDVQPEPDGSFSAELQGATGDEFRLQALFEGRRSRPLDVIVAAEGVILPAPQPLTDCLLFEPGAWIEIPAGGSGSLTLVNRCDAPVELGPPLLRRPEAPFTITSAPTEIDAGDQAVLILALDAGEDDAEEVLLLEVTAPTTGRRPVTLVGRPR